jgi:non-lysosomal glucosylceramidase
VAEGGESRPHSSSWPVARTYRGEDRVRISLPVGGIGTGSIGFGGRAQFRDWELENHPSKGLRSELTFLACHVHGTTTAPVARVLEGNLFDEETEGALGSPAPLAGLPRFAECEFETTYPFGRARLSDPNFPVHASVEVFNPFSPGDEEISGLPIAVIKVGLQSAATEPLDCDVMFSLEALVGHARRSEGRASNPRASARSEADMSGYLFSDEAVDLASEDWGTIAAGVLGEGSWVGPTWGLGKWNQGLFHMWRGFVEHGQPGPGTFAAGADEPAITFGSAIAGTIGAKRVLGPHEAAEVVFLMGWHFPNRRAWAWGRHGPEGASGAETVGNFYTNNFADALDVVRTQARRLPALREVTERFTCAFWESDLSPAVKEAALFNLSTLRTQTFFRDSDGHPLGWEGCLDEVGSCPGSCTHVWNYDLATPFLFASLARQMRELEYLHATADDGAMSFRIMLPLEKALEHQIAAADGQFGSVLKLFREWRLGGDDDWLKRIWPACRRSLEFAWVEGGWDADHDGLAEGAQHNTTDIEYYGPNPVVQSWYLAALAAAVEMAGAVGDSNFARTCQEILQTGKSATEAALFNGLYYQQRIMPPDDFSSISPRLRHASMGAQNARDPEFQVGDGCPIDQLVGDTYARLVGLSRLLDADHVKSALSSIHNLNYVPDFGDWTNYMRTYAVKGERGHIVLSYPHGLPEHPMPYWCEVWTGVEYVYAIGLVHEGQSELAEDVVAAARDRFSGRRRNPFDEAECGHHYARALSSWGLVPALTGFRYDARTGTMTFAPAADRTTWFWSSGAAWGTVEQTPTSGGQSEVSLQVMDGRVHVDRVLVGTAVFRPEVVGDLSRGNYPLRDGTSTSVDGARR